MTETTTLDAGANTANECKCGCGQTAENVYRQGHDAKHVSILLSYIAAGDVSREAAMAVLPTTALKVKLNNALARRQRIAAEQAERKAAREAARAARKTGKAKKAEAEPSYTEVKVGRWWYPIVEIREDNGILYTARDGSIKEAPIEASVR